MVVLHSVANGLILISDAMTDFSIELHSKLRGGVLLADGVILISDAMTNFPIELDKLRGGVALSLQMP